MEKLLTPKEVALMLGITEAALGQWRYRGIGPTYRRLSPRIVRYALADVEEYVERSAEQQTGQVLTA